MEAPFLGAANPFYTVSILFFDGSPPPGAKSIAVFPRRRSHLSVAGRAFLPPPSSTLLRFVSALNSLFRPRPKEEILFLLPKFTEVAPLRDFSLVAVNLLDSDTSLSVQCNGGEGIFSHIFHSSRFFPPLTVWRFAPLVPCSALPLAIPEGLESIISFSPDPAPSPVSGTSEKTGRSYWEKGQEVGRRPRWHSLPHAFVP